MKNVLTERLALNGLLALLSFSVVFHLAILAGLIPFQIVWGGRLTDKTQMVRFETVSVALNLAMLAVACVKAGIIGTRISPAAIRVAIWAMAGLFLLNTLGNLFSKNDMERMIFTPVTLLLSLFCIRLGLAAGNKGKG